MTQLPSRDLKDANTGYQAAWSAVGTRNPSDVDFYWRSVGVFAIFDTICNFLLNRGSIKIARSFSRTISCFFFFGPPYCHFSTHRLLNNGLFDVGLPVARRRLSRDYLHVTLPKSPSFFLFRRALWLSVHGPEIYICSADVVSIAYTMSGTQGVRMSVTVSLLHTAKKKKKKEMATNMMHRGKGSISGWRVSMQGSKAFWKKG